MKNEENMQVEWDQPQYSQAHCPHTHYPQNQYPQQQYPQPRGVKILETEDKEDLVVEEAKLYVIIVDNHHILPRYV